MLSTSSSSPRGVRPSELHELLISSHSRPPPLSEELPAEPQPAEPISDALDSETMESELSDVGVETIFSI